MLIIFDPDTNELDAINPKLLEELFAELSRINRMGRHFVIIGRKVCSWATQNLDLSGMEKSQVSRIGHEYTQSGTLIDTAPCSLSIKVDGRMISEVTPNKYVIGIDRFLNSNYSRETVLLVEHIENDGSFYKYILDEMKKKAVIKNYMVDINNGGGTAIVPCFQGKINEQRSVVCVLDSDKHAPNDRVSSTVKSVKKIARASVYVGNVLETVGHEIENFIPIDIYRQYLFPEYQHYNIIEKLVQNQKLKCNGECLWLYFDIKTGILGSRLVDKGLSKQTLDWVSQKYLSDNQEIEDLSIPGLGTATMSQFNAIGGAKSAYHSFTRSDYWHEHFEEFFSNLYWYFVAAKKKAAI